MAHDKMIVLTLRDDADTGDVLELVAHCTEETREGFAPFGIVESVQVRPFEPLVKPDGE